MELKPNQQKVFEYLKECSNSHVPPTVREICAATGIKSTSTVFGILTALEKAGLISRNGGAARAIQIEGAAKSVSVPLVGTVTAGAPITAIENIEKYLPLSSDITRGREVFALKVKGMSMMNAGILDGDIIYAEKASAAERGDIVVALIDDEATVKRLDFADNGSVVLMPENDAFSPIVPDTVIILGKVIASFRQY